MPRTTDRLANPTIVIGAGLMGGFHSRAAAHAGASIVGIVDADPAAADRLGARYPRAARAGSIGELLSRTAARVAHVCTPLPSHAALMGELADAGIHALVEKPMVETAPDTETLIARFNAAGRFVCPTHQYAFQPCFERAIVAASSLGGVRRVDFDICSAGGGRDTAQFDRIAAEILPHPLSMLQRLFPNTDIADLDWRLTRAAVGEWMLSTAIDGTLITIAISLGGRPTCYRTAIRCEHGAIELNNFHGYGIVMPGSTGRAEKLIQPFARAVREIGTAGAHLVRRGASREAGYPGLRQLVRRFHEAVGASDQAMLPIASHEVIAGARARDRILALVEEARHDRG